MLRGVKIRVYPNVEQHTSTIDILQNSINKHITISVNCTEIEIIKTISNVYNRHIISKNKKDCPRILETIWDNLIFV